MSALATSVSSAAPESRCCSGMISMSGLIAAQRLLAGFGLGHADACLGVQNLALQIGEIDRVVIDQRYFSNASRGKIERRRRTQTTGTDDQGMSIEDALLAFNAQCVKQNVAAVA
jgi:hypothetical protein